MPTFDLTRGTRAPARRRRRLLLVAALAAGAVAVTVTVVAGGEESADGGQLGPTAVAARRDLATTLEASGTLQRSSEHTVAHAAAVEPDGDSPPPDGSGGNGDGDDDGGDGDDDVPSAVLTGVADVGTTSGRGTVLYTADAQPVVALVGDLPAWRTLEAGVDDGADVRQLEENLVALGYGAGLDVDGTYTAGTAAAVEDWETDLGRAAPDGVVSAGDVVFLTEPGDVLGHEAAVGATLEAGTPVLTVGSEQRIVVADVDAAAGGWTPGSTVELEWADTTTTTGTVVGTGREVTDGRVELVVAIGAGDPGAGGRRSGAEATVTLVDARRDGVVAVPVAAVVDDSGSPAVRVAPASSGPDRVVPVETGLVADGWVEITAGLDGGEEVRLPG